uniref:tRNA (guanine-N(7)-)-methyltransferase non-catalytic subunit n=1 Tax=Arundo donax TaxID=35708 RepID=A0A0A9FSK2_ARUDO
MEDTTVDEAEVSGAAEFAPALVAAHPQGHSVAVAVGPELRVFDLKAGCAVSLSDDCGGRFHSDAIRAICFSVDGALFASAGDDKLVKVWKTDSWRCIQTITSEKRVSSVAISNDGLYVTFADKFGVIWLVTLGEHSGEQVSVDNKPVPIVGHYCSIITSMKFSPDGRFIATADRDFKIRVTLFPKNPLKGAHEIQSFCLGHTDFVSCIAFTSKSEGQRFLISGGGDSTVCLWDYINGYLLDTCQVRDKVEELLEPNETDDSNLAIADICLSNDGSLVAVAIQGFNGVMLLTCDLIAKKLSFLKVITMEKSYIPTSLATSFSSKLLWSVMGASNMPNQAASQLLTRLRIIPRFQKNLLSSSDNGPAMLEDTEVPHSEKLLLALQGSLDIAKQEEVLASVLAALKVSMHKMLVKKHYSEERREQRKRGRNDKKIKN